jgi:hypothetical protein
MCGRKSAASCKVNASEDSWRISVMASSPWRHLQPTEPLSEYTALLGFVGLRSLAVFPRFAWYGFQIERQLRRAPGIVGYRLETDFAHLRFYHLSVWRNEAAIGAFVHNDPHRAAMQKLINRLGETKFRYWTVRGSELPLHFDREVARLT